MSEIKTPSPPSSELLKQTADFIEKSTIPFNEVPEARDFARILEDVLAKHTELEQKEPELFYRLQKDVILLKIVALTLINEKEMLALIEKHYADHHDIPYCDIWVKTRARLGTIIPFEERDELKKTIRETLLRNNQLLTKNGIVVGTKERKGTVRNWLLDYHRAVGTEIADSLQITQYINNSQNTADLSQEERYRIAVLVHYYERLKRSSFTIDGLEGTHLFEGEDGHTYVLKDGELEDVDSNKELNRIIKELQEQGFWPKEDAIEVSSARLQMSNQVQEPPDQPILAAYNTLPVPLDAIRAKTIELKERLAQSPHIVEQILERPESVKDKAYVVAALVLQVNMMNAKLQMLNQVQMSNADTEKMRVFIRMILEDKLGWRAEDSSKLGIRIGNLLGEPYKGWAAYNKTTQKFEWIV